MDKKTNRWIVVGIIVAVVAALAAVAVYLMRAREKSKVWYDQDAIDCDDCECFEFDDEDIEIADVESDE